MRQLAGTLRLQNSQRVTELGEQNTYRDVDENDEFLRSLKFNKQQARQ